MLGMETDVFVIDLEERKAYNLGYSAGDVTKLMNEIAPGSTTLQKASRFLIIGGIEWGIDTTRGRTITTTYSPRVKKMAKYFATNYPRKRR